MNTKWYIHPEEYAVGENERFYADMSAQGWRLVSRGMYLSRFQREEPMKELYRVEICLGELPAEQRDLYSDCGWEYVTKRGYVNIFRAPEGSVMPELYSDPREQAQTMRRMFHSYLAVVLVMIPLIAAMFALGGPDIIYGFIRRLVLATPFALFLVTMVLCAVWVEAAGLVRTYAMYRALRRGVPLDHSPKGRKVAHVRIFLALEIAFLVLSAVQLIGTWRAPLPRASNGVYITLSELGIEGERTGILSDVDDSSITRSRSLLADVIDTRETVSQGQDWVTLDQEIYMLHIPLLSVPFARAVIHTASYSRGDEEFGPIEVPGWDWVRASDMGCVAIRGGTVAHIYIFDPNDKTWDQRCETFARVLTRIAEREDGYENH